MTVYNILCVDSLTFVACTGLTLLHLELSRVLHVVLLHVVCMDSFASVQLLCSCLYV